MRLEDIAADEMLAMLIVEEEERRYDEEKLADTSRTE